MNFRIYIVSQNDMVSLWERNIGKTLEKIYVSEEELLKSIQGDHFYHTNSFLISHTNQVNKRMTKSLSFHLVQIQ